MHKQWIWGLMASVAVPGWALAADPVALHDIVVVGTTPLAGAGIELDKVPSNVQVIKAADQQDRHPGSLSDLLDNRLGSISVNDYTGNALQQSINFRGYSASPLIGQAQGLAVYENGMRLNQSFGDVVLWDLHPAFAVDEIQVIPGSNPAFGLNALGGAIALHMKDGFHNSGASVDAGGGSFGRSKVTAEFGTHSDVLGFYSGLSALRDDGWRNRSPSQGVQSYTDLAVRKGDLDAGLGLTMAATSLTGNGATPTGLLSQNWNSIFTSPDLQQNALISLNMRAAYDLNDHLTVQGGGYYRHLRTGSHNGNTLTTTGLTDRAGNTLPNTDNADIVNSIVNSDSFGASSQLTSDYKMWGLDNQASLGTSADVGYTHYVVNTEAGVLNDNRAVIGTGNYIGTGQNYDALLNSTNQYYGLFFTDSLALTNRLTWTVSGRYNLALIDLHDLAGTGLTGNHHFDRFNPGTGLTFKLTPQVTAYVSYAEANRAPTPAELGCSDPSAPCTVQSALNSDPDLKQVVSRSVEAGLRGSHKLDGGHIGWTLGGFGSRNFDDIIFVMTDPTAGQGYFQNTGITQREGLEAGTDLTLGRFKASANYAYVLATFQSHTQMYSPNNPAANGSGQIDVVPGDRMPGVPLHSLKLDLSYALTDLWNVEADAKITSKTTMLGDESNTMSRLPGISTVDLGTTYALPHNATIYVRAQNVFDQRYATSGTVADPTGGVSITSTSSNNAFWVPGQPRTFWAGMRMTF